jgi:hypothetical protein
LDPALREADGLAAAVAAMKPKDIRVVAYVNTLAWQNPEDPVHWLNKHPDWLDVDVLGRGRLQWTKEHPNAVSSFPGMSDVSYNYVRASEPQVQARLSALVKALADRKEIDAVAFAAATPPNLPSFFGSGIAAPPLGYSMADRLAVFQKTGADPADAVGYEDRVPESVRVLAGYASRDDQNAPVNARTALLSRLFKEAKAARPAWRAYLLNDAPSMEDFGANPAKPGAGDSVKPDLVIGNVFASASGGALGRGIVFPISRKNLFDAMAEADEGAPSKATMDRLRDIPPMVIFQTFFSQVRGMSGQNLPMALYDFRAAPELITDSLKWVKAPDTPAAK